MNEVVPGGGRSPFSLNVKLTLLVVLPVLTLAFLATGAQRYIEHVGSQTIAELKSGHKESLELSGATRSLRRQVDDYAQQLVLFTDNHQNSLLDTESTSSSQPLEPLKIQALNLIDTIVRELAPVRQSFVRSAGAKDTMAAFDKRYHFVVRRGRTLPKLLDILTESHDRTVGLRDAGLFDRARTQFVFEERGRVHAVQTAVKDLIGGLDNLAISVENHIAGTTSRVITDADLATNAAMTMTTRSAAIAVVVIALIAIFVIRLAVSRPITRLTLTMLRLARDELDVPIAGKRRRDEVGDMVGALQVFKDNAIERKKIEEDLAEHRNHLETLVEARTEQIEQQKVEIEKALEESQSATKLKSEFLASIS